MRPGQLSRISGLPGAGTWMGLGRCEEKPDQAGGNDKPSHQGGKGGHATLREVRHPSKINPKSGRSASFVKSTRTRGGENCAADSPVLEQTTCRKPEQRSPRDDQPAARHHYPAAVLAADCPSTRPRPGSVSPGTTSRTPLRGVWIMARAVEDVAQHPSIEDRGDVPGASTPARRSSPAPRSERAAGRDDRCVAGRRGASGQAMIDPIERLAGPRDLGRSVGLGLVGAIDAVGDLGDLGVRLLGGAFDARLQIASS